VERFGRDLEFRGEWGGKLEDYYNWEVGKGRDILFWEDD